MSGRGTRARRWLDRARDGLTWRLRPGRMIRDGRPRPDPALEQVYLDRNLILIHIPKNAGTSVEDALYGYRVRHRTWKELRDTCPAAWESVPKIAIIRDPVDRFLSAYDYVSEGGRNALDRGFGAHVIGDLSIEAFSARLAENPRFRRVVMDFFHFRPQSDFVCDADGPVVDHLVPFPHMAEGLRRFAGVPPESLAHSNKTRGARTLRSDLTPKVLARIADLYREDVDLYRQTCDTWDAADPAPETR